MVQNKLNHIKGQLLEMFVEMYRDMNTGGGAQGVGIDYENFYDEVQAPIVQIRGIKTLTDLETFCEEYGLNDEITNPMSFPALVAEAYKQ